MLRDHSVRYAIGAAAVMATLFTFGVNNNESPPFKFADRWSAVPAHAAPLLAKQVRTLSFIPPTTPANPALPEIDGFLHVPMPPIKSQEKLLEPKLAVVARAEHRETKGPDICRGKGRIITRGGKSWRCRR